MKYAGGINKNAAREAQREADVVAERLLKTCSEPKRDLGKISADIADLRSRTSMLKPAQSYDLSKDWRLVFASDDDAISVVGTGLHKLPLTRIQVTRADVGVHASTTTGCGEAVARESGVDLP